MRLIDADKLPRRRYPEYDETGEFIDVMCVKAEDIDNAPTEQLWLISSRWIKGRDNTYCCLKCGSEDSRSSRTGNFFKYCPNCSSLMENGGK